MDENIGKGLTMLILDDEEVVCEIGKGYFEKQGFNVQASLTIKDALSRINKNKFDVSLLDLHLEGGSGIDVLRVLREKQPRCQCIILTVENQESIVGKARAMGVADYLIKPLRLQEINKAVDKAVKKIREEVK